MSGGSETEYPQAASGGVFRRHWKLIEGQKETLLPIPGKEGKEAAASKPVARRGTGQADGCMCSAGCR
jgi:hypothetical protein